MIAPLLDIIVFIYSYSARCRSLLFFFFNDTATTEIYTLSLHDALPISESRITFVDGLTRPEMLRRLCASKGFVQDRKSTRLNSSHQIISYAVFCLKKKKKSNSIHPTNNMQSVRKAE